MSEDTEIFKIIADYFSGEITDADKKILDHWLKDSANKETFKACAKANYFVISTPDYKMNKEKTLKIDFRPAILKFAAVFLLLLTVGALWKFAFVKSTDPSPQYISISIDGQFDIIKDINKKTVLSDAEKVPLAVMENGVLRMSGNPSSNQLIIDVPNGKKLKVLLQDGSEVLLNSATELSFNSNFIQPDARTVRLKGEAFFEVAKDAAHPFYVKSQNFTTKVLGTRFNVSSYADVNQSFVNLVEGKIEVQAVNGSAKNTLSPGEKFSFDKKTQSAGKESANPVQDMDWLNKNIAFNNNTMDEVLNKIERVYGLEIIRKDLKPEQSHFSGTFKTENLDQIISSLEALLNCTIEQKKGQLILSEKNTN